MMDLLQSELVHYKYTDWIRHFEENDKKRLRIDFSEEPELSPMEKKLIFPSVRAFQKGEGSDGRYLMKTAEAFAEKMKETDYPKAMRWFIKEENFHSAYLKQIMDHYGIPAAQRNLLDRIFRRFRKGGGIRREVVVLVTAEIIALSYYTALKACCSSPALKRVCDQMLEDEVPHVIFQSFTLAHFKKSQMMIRKRIFLMNISCLAVYLRYRKVFFKGGYPLRKLLQNSRQVLQQSISLM